MKHFIRGAAVLLILAAAVMGFSCTQTVKLVSEQKIEGGGTTHSGILSRLCRFKMIGIDGVTHYRASISASFEPVLMYQKSVPSIGLQTAVRCPLPTDGLSKPIERIQYWP